MGDARGGVLAGFGRPGCPCARARLAGRCRVRAPGAAVLGRGACLVA